jgi:hypothetical protein
VWSTGLIKRNKMRSLVPPCSTTTILSGYVDSRLLQELCSPIITIAGRATYRQTTTITTAFTLYQHIPRTIAVDNSAVVYIPLLPEGLTYVWSFVEHHTHYYYYCCP